VSSNTPSDKHRRPETSRIDGVQHAAKVRNASSANSDQFQFLQSDMDCGRFTKDAVEMPDAFACLGENHDRFDASGARYCIEAKGRCILNLS